MIHINIFKFKFIYIFIFLMQGGSLVSLWRALLAVAIGWDFDPADTSTWGGSTAQVPQKFNSSVKKEERDRQTDR